MLFATRNCGHNSANTTAEEARLANNTKVTPSAPSDSQSGAPAHRGSTYSHSTFSEILTRMPPSRTKAKRSALR